MFNYRYNLPEEAPTEQDNEATAKELIYRRLDRLCGRMPADMNREQRDIIIPSLVFISCTQLLRLSESKGRDEDAKAHLLHQSIHMSLQWMNDRHPDVCVKLKAFADNQPIDRYVPSDPVGLMMWVNNSLDIIVDNLLPFYVEWVTAVVNVPPLDELAQDLRKLTWHQSAFTIARLAMHLTLKSL